MAQRLLNLRVRPARLAILINKVAGRGEFIRVVRFLSQIWGGRYSPILPVSADQADPLTEFRLGAHRPDFVYGVGINDEHWTPVVHRVCQPRHYGSLTASVAEDVRRSHDGFIHVDRAVIAMFEARNARTRHNRVLKVVTTAVSSQLAPYCAAMFGVHHANLADEFRDEHISFESDDPTEFIDLCRDFVQGWKRSWLDVSGFGLSPHYTMRPPVEPTIVLVNDAIRDLSQFWNLRLASETVTPVWIIPVPVNRAFEPAVRHKLREWLLAFLEHGKQPNYCLVTSESVAEQDCTAFAAELRATLEGTVITEVDYEPPRNHLPDVLPYEYTAAWPVQLQGRRLTMTPPPVKVLPALGTSESWFVDILSDTGTGRAVKDLQLPGSVVVPELLSGPCPPSFEHSAIRRVGDGVDSINVRCSATKEVIRFHIPSPAEVLEELLREQGYEIVRDEKRSSYLPTIKKFGTLHQAASAFVGQPGQILSVLAGPDRTVNDEPDSQSSRNTRGLPKTTFTPDELRGKCRLGSGLLSGEDYFHGIDQMLVGESNRIARIARRRYEQYARRHFPEKMALGLLLEHWADKSILKRRWKLGPCRRCNQSYFVERLNIQKPVLCSNCGSRLSLPEQVPIGYSLDRAVRHAIWEGIIPVVLTGRFLRNMTHRGFFWLPGVKYQKGTASGDVDILACCDGYLVFGECKTAPQHPDMWNRITDQFVQLAAVACECKANLVVLSAQVPEFPDHVKNRIESELDGRVPFLLLNQNDLAKGHRLIEEAEPTSWMTFIDLMPDQFPERVIERTGKPRQIKSGWSVFTRSGGIKEAEEA